MSLLQPPPSLATRLDPGERLLWWDRPKQSIYLTKSDYYLIPFSLLWGGFAFFWEYMVVTQLNAPLFFRLWGIPFVLVGIYLIVGRFFYDAWRRRRLTYGLTDSRVLIATPTACRSLELNGLGEMNLEERSDGEGSIAFGSTMSLWRILWLISGKNWGAWSSAPAVPTFERIPNAQRVLTVIREAQRRAIRRDERRSG